MSQRLGPTPRKMLWRAQSRGVFQNLRTMCRSPRANICCGYRSLRDRRFSENGPVATRMSRSHGAYVSENASIFLADPFRPGGEPW
jgi:hypothetical protein